MKTNIAKILFSLLTVLALLAAVGALAEDAGAGVTLLVNGETPESLNLKTHERFFVRVPLPEGTTMARVAEVIDGRAMGYAYLFDWDDWGEKLEEGSWGWADEYADVGDFTLYAQVTTDEIDWDNLDWETFDWDEDVEWSDPGNALTIHVTGEGEVGESDLSVPTTVTRGEPLTLEVNAFGKDVGWLWCNVFYEDEDGSHFLYDNHVEVYSPDVSGSIGTVNLEPGEYKLHVSNVPAKPGMLEVYQTFEFTVTAPAEPWAEDAFLFSVVPSEGLTAHQSFALSAYRAGAEVLRVYKDDGERIDQLAERDGDTLVQECGDLDAGHYALYAEALVDGEWLRSESVELDVIAEAFEGFAIDAPAFAAPGEDYTFTVKNLGLADDWWWDVTINRIVEGEDWPCVYRVTADDMSATETEGVITVPGYVLEEGDAGYEIRVYADARRYGSSDLTGGFYVTAGEPEDVTLTARYGEQESAEAIAMPVFGELELSVPVPEGATGLKLYDGRGFRLVYEFWETEDGVVTWTEEPESENTMYFVSFSYDEGLLDADLEDVRLDDYEWGGISNAIAVTFEYSDAALVVPEAAAEGDTFTRGDEISLIISLPEPLPEGAIAPTRLHAFFTDLNGEFYGEGDWNSDEPEWPVEATLSTAELPADNVYNIILDYAAEGTEWKHLSVKRVAVEGVPLTLELDGERESMRILTHQSVGMFVNLPDDATDARLVIEKYYFDEDDNINEDDEPEIEYDYIDELENKRDAGHWSMKLDCGWPERHVMYVEISTEREEWCRQSNRVTLDIVVDPENPDGETDPSDVRLVSDSVAQGEPLEFTVDYGAEDSNVEWLWCFVHHVAEDEDGNPEFDEDESWLEPNGVSVYRPQAAASIPTANLVPGTYYLQVNGVANVPGLWESVQMVEFTVTEPSWNDDDFYFTVSPSEGLLAHQEFAVTARMAGAKAIRVLRDDGESVEALIDWQDGDTLSATAELGEGSYTLYAQADMGEDAEERYVKNAEADNQLLNVGVLEGLEDYEIVAPAIAEPGEPYAFAINHLDQANDFWWELRVSRIVPDEDWEEILYLNSDDLSADPEQAFEIPADEMIEGCSYEISLWADTRFYGGREVTARFYVSERERDEGIRVTAYYDKQEIEPDEENGDVTVTMPNRGTLLLVIEAEGARALKLYNGNDWEFNDDFDDGRWETTVCPEADSPIYFASAYYDEIDWDALEAEDKGWEDLDWSGPSNVVSVNVIYDGDELTPPVASVKDIEEDFARGDTVEVTIEKPEEDADCGTDFHVYFSDLNGERYESGDWSGDDVTLPVTVELRTADLPEDNAYNVMVDYVAEGRAWQSVNAGRIYVVGTEDMRFSVTGIESVGENAYRALGNQEIRFSAYKAGADHVWVFWDEADADEGDHRFDPFRGEESVSDTLREGEEGDYVIYAVAYDRRDNVIDESDKLSVRVEYDQLPDPEITAASVADEGEDYTFEVSGLETEGADWWWLEVYDEDEKDEDDNMACVFDANRNWNAGETEFTIPLDRLQPNHTYWICAHVNGDGYEGGYSEFGFFVKPASTEHELTLAVEKSGEGMVHHSDDWKITVHAPEAIAVRLRVDSEWFYDDATDIDENADRVYNGWWFDESGAHELLAQGLYGDIDPETIDWGDGEALNKLGWTDVSNTVEVEVNSKGETNPAALDRDQYEAIPGESIEVFIVNIDADDPKSATHFHAYIQSEDGEVDWENDVNLDLSDPEQAADSFEIVAGEDLDPEREYWLVVDACAEDYDWAQTRVPLEVCFGRLDAPEVNANPVVKETDGFKFSVENLFQQGEDNARYDIRAYQDGVEYGDGEWAWRTTPDDDPYTGEFAVTGLKAGFAYTLDVWVDAYRYVGNSAQFRFVVYDESQVLTLPAALTSLGDSAFEGVAAQVIVLPEDFNVDSLGEDTFKDCPNLLAVVSGDRVICLD